MSFVKEKSLVWLHLFSELKVKLTLLRWLMILSLVWLHILLPIMQ